MGAVGRQCLGMTGPKPSSMVVVKTQMIIDSNGLGTIIDVAGRTKIISLDGAITSTATVRLIFQAVVTRTALGSVKGSPRYKAVKNNKSIMGKTLKAKITPTRSGEGTDGAAVSTKKGRKVERQI